jgi:hypothetical protein
MEELIMYEASADGSPAPLTGNLDEILESGIGEEEKIMVQITHNMGNRTFLFSMPMKKFHEKSLVANERGNTKNPQAQRPLNAPHATKLAKFMLKGLIGATREKLRLEKKHESDALTTLEEMLGKQPYVSMQPLVCNLRDVNPYLHGIRGERVLSSDTRETVGYRVWLPQTHMLYVVDGQHRKEGMRILFDFLNGSTTPPQKGGAARFPTKNNLLSPLKGELTVEQKVALQEILITASTFANVQIESHLGLDMDQERQLFHDLNNLGKKVEASLALQFDSSNPVNNFIKEVLIDDDSIMPWDIVEKDITDWRKDTGAIGRKELVSINARLFLNKTNISGATPIQVDTRKQVAIDFWTEVVQIKGLGNSESKLKTVAAQPVVLKALSKLVYDFAFGKKPNKDHLSRILDSICDETKLDFSHENPIWRYYQLTEEERIKQGVHKLKDYLPSDSEGYNRDIGNYDSIAKTMRFGSKHNDIFPILGDMIRYALGLPSRHS